MGAAKAEHRWWVAGLGLVVGALLLVSGSARGEEPVIAGSVSEWKTIAGAEAFAKALEFLERADLAELEPGRHDIDGDDVFALVSVGETRSTETAQFEAHRRYVDVQHLVDGQETVGVASPSSLAGAVPYDETKDIEFFANPPEFETLELHAGGFVIFFPHHAHLPSLHLEGPHTVRKVVVKVSVALLDRARGDAPE